MTPTNILSKTKTSRTTKTKLKKGKEEEVSATKKPIAKKKRIKKSRYHTGIYNSPKCKKPISYRSGWEKTVCEHLDADSNVKEYFYEDLIIAYKSRITQIKLKKYIIDFFVVYNNGTKKIIEVKADNKVNHPITLKKTAAARDWCSKNGVIYEIWTSIQIQQILKEQKQKLAMLSPK